MKTFLDILAHLIVISVVLGVSLILIGVFAFVPDSRPYFVMIGGILSFLWACTRLVDKYTSGDSMRFPH